MNRPISNPELEMAAEFVRHTGCNIFLTGRAGTGKTTFLHAIRKRTPKRLVVTAPTGVAAINAGGVTLHSFFQLPFGPFIPGSEARAARYRFRREKKNIIRSLDLLVIDEISMVRADLLDGVDSVLRRCRRSELPFGGVQLLMIGDLCQLSPVVKKEDWELLRNHYDTPYFFSSTALARTEVVSIELKHIYRQSDQHFIELLNRVRDGRPDPPTLERLNSRHIPGFAPADGEGYITLCTHNQSADAINVARLRGLAGKRRRFEAALEGEFPEQAFPTAAALELKPGAQVMFIRNDMSAAKSYYNGKIGRITGMADDIVKVLCPGDSGPIEVARTTWENIEYSVDPQTAEISEKVIGTFSQYPLRLAWAITIHKSQGLTFDKAIIDAQAAFAPGQVYVALSRCRSLEGMVLSSPLTPAAVKSDPLVQRFVTEAAGHPPTPERLAAARREYQEHLLLEGFSFERLRRLLGRLAMLLRTNHQVIQVAGGDITSVQARAAAEICKVGESFQRQLRKMFAAARLPSADPAILDRLSKAEVYFGEKVAEILSPFFENFALETDNKEVRRKITAAVKELREETTVKLAGMRSCRDGFEPGEYLRAVSAAAMETEPPRAKDRTSVYTEADVGHPELFESLRAWRREKAAAEGLAHFQVMHQKTLVQIAVRLPDTMEALEKIKGIGKRLAEKYGAELIALVAEYRRRHHIEDVMLPDPPAVSAPETPGAAPAEKEDSREASLRLFDQGLTLSQIAARRNLAPATIEGHIAFFVSRGQVAVEKLVAGEKRQQIARQIAAMPDAPLKALKTALGDDVSYSEIKLVLAHLQYRDQR